MKDQLELKQENTTSSAVCVLGRQDARFGSQARKGSASFDTAWINLRQDPEPQFRGEASRSQGREGNALRCLC